MKPKMMSKNSLEYLFHHILDGFKASHEGIVQLQRDHAMSDEEIHELIKKNSERLIDRIREFRLTEKLMSVFFALLFGYMQINGDDLEMRRPARVRTTSARVRNSRTGRRRNEHETTTI
jgi:hypothetical protein